MKALVYTRPLTLDLRDEPEPVPGPGELLVRVDACGICGSDMHGYHGHDSRRVPPLILGHEAAGRVAAGPQAGRRVAINPLVTCGVCDACVSGRANLCAKRALIGMARPGAFAEMVTIPAVNVCDVPDHLPAEHAALAEPTAVAVHAAALAARASARPLGECDALVIGGGGIGVLAALVLQSHGVRRLRVAETNPLRRAPLAARSIGAPFDPIAEPQPEGRFDVVIDAVGADATRRMAVHAVRPGGVVVHVGLQGGDGGLDIRRITLQEITVVGTYTYTPLDFRTALRGLAEGAYGDLSWIERRPLDEGARAFADLDEGRSAAAKIVLVP